jgi:hypothetical protein
MLKSIHARDIKVGDVIGRNQNQVKAVEKITHEHGMIKLWFVDKTSLLCVGEFVLWHLDYQR